MTMGPKENMIETLNWGNPEYVPLNQEVNPWLILAGGIEEPWFGGKDCFGIPWVLGPEGAQPDPHRHMQDDITQWREFVTFPDLDQIDFREMAKQELAGIDPDRQMVNMLYPCGLFERFVSFMGYVDGLIAMVEEPEACREFFDEMSKFKSAVIERMIDAYHPDIITYADDLCTAKAPFMSIDTYREIVRPYHRRIADTIISHDVIFCQHMCGKAEELMEDVADMGCRMWNSVQVMNDIPVCQEKFKGRMVLEGGWDTQGPAGYINPDLDLCLAEVHRCLTEYGPNGGYVCWPVIFSEKGNGAMVGDPRIDAILEKWPEISRFDSLGAGLPTYESIAQA